MTYKLKGYRMVFVILDLQTDQYFWQSRDDEGWTREIRDAKYFGTREDADKFIAEANIWMTVELPDYIRIDSICVREQ